MSGSSSFAQEKSQERLGSSAASRHDLNVEIAMNMPRHINQSRSCPGGRESNSVRIIVHSFSTARQAPARLLIEERRRNWQVAMCGHLAGLKTRPRERQPGSPNDGSNQTGRTDRGPNIKLRPAAPREAGDDARQPMGLR